MSIDVRMLAHDEASVLDRVEDGVFDGPIDPRWTREFFSDSRHHIAVATQGSAVVGFATGLVYVHPDKGPELWINEVGVAPDHRRLGLGMRLVTVLCEHGAHLGCRAAWVLTEGDNVPARRLYGSLGGREPGSETVMVEFELPLRG